MERLNGSNCEALTLEYCPYGFFLVLTHLFLQIFKVYWRLLAYDWHFREMVFQTIFFLFLGGDASCSYRPFLLVFRISRTGPVLSPKICGNGLSTKVSMARKRLSQAKKEAQQGPGAASLTLQFNKCYTWYETVFFWPRHGRTRKVRERSPGTREPDSLFGQKICIFVVKLGQLDASSWRKKDKSNMGHKVCPTILKVSQNDCYCWRFQGVSALIF